MFIALIVSIVLILWLLKLKKNDPFPKHTLLKLMLGGLISFILAGLLSVVLMLCYAIVRFTPAAFFAALKEAMDGNMDALKGFDASNPSIFLAAFKSIVFIGLVEEVLKYINMRIAAKKPGSINNRFDAVVLCALSGLGFQIFEDISYVSSGGMAVAILRAFLPLHFVFGAIMGFFYGRYLENRKGSDLFKAFAIPTVIHGFFDLCVLNFDKFDFLVPFALLCLVGGFVISIVFIVKINKWSKDEALREPLP
jgi:RsiW-degrading membrane proteinase PrsW (M82 family)